MPVGNHAVFIGNCSIPHNGIHLSYGVTGRIDEESPGFYSFRPHGQDDHFIILSRNFLYIPGQIGSKNICNIKP
jgi:hypothetical protein